MKQGIRKFIALFSSMCLVVGLMPSPALAADATNDTQAVALNVQDFGEPGVDYVPGEALVVLNGTVDDLAAATQADGVFGMLSTEKTAAGVSFTINESVASVSTTAVQESLTTQVQQAEADGTTDEAAASALGALDASSADECDIVKVSGEDTEQLVAALNTLDCVAFAQPNFYYELYDADHASLAETATQAAAELEASATADATPAADFATETTTPGGTTITDPMYKYQWALNGTGYAESSNTLNVEGAWDAGAAARTEEKIVVAVIDTGVDYNHPDLKNVMWADGEKYQALTDLGGGKYGIDTSNEFLTDDPMDTSVGHGTHCASTIASEWNDIGITGINPNVQIMAVRMIGDTSTSDSALKAYNYVITAKQCGVNVCVTNNSWGPSYTSSAYDGALSSIINDAGEYGIISVFAAGNNSTDNDKNPGMAHFSDYVLEVGALSSTGKAADFSGYGQRNVDVFSPGTRVLAGSSTYKVSPPATMGMEPEYIPWATDVLPDGSLDTTRSLFMDTFEEEGAQLHVTYSLYTYGTDMNAGQLLSNNIYSVEPLGYDSNYRARLDLSALKEVGQGTNYYVRMDVSAQNINDLITQAKSQGNSDVYFACIGGFQEISQPSRLNLYYQKNYQWTSAQNGLRTYDGSWTNISIRIPLATLQQALNPDGSFTMLLAGTTNASDMTNAAVYLDNVAMGFERSDYYYSDGTSMATPNAAGVVSLLASAAADKLAIDPNDPADTMPTAQATAKEIVAYVKGGVTQNAALDGKCATGGVVNAETSYTSFVDQNSDALTPVPNRMTFNSTNSTVTLEGYFFGDEQGTSTLTIDGAPVSVTSWTDTAVTFAAPFGSDRLATVQLTRENLDGSTKTAKCLMTLTLGGTRGYTQLTAPSMEVTIPTGKFQGKTFNAADADVYHMTATAKAVFALMLYEPYNYSFLLRYDPEGKTWSCIHLPNDTGSGLSVSEGLCSMTASETQVYIYAMAASETSKSKLPHLLTYNDTFGDWISDACAFDSTKVLGTVCYRDKALWIIGEEKTTSVKKVYSDNLKSYATMEDMLQVGVGGVTVNTGIGMVSIGSHADETFATDGQGQGGPRQNAQVYTYSGLTNKGTWSVSGKAFYTLPQGTSDYLDAGQVYVQGVAAAARGAVVVGPQMNGDTANVVDTWYYDAPNDSWTSLPGAVFSTTHVSSIGAASCNSTVYVLGRSGDDGTLMFKSLSMAGIGSTPYFLAPQGDALTSTQELIDYTPAQGDCVYLITATSTYFDKRTDVSATYLLSTIAGSPSRSTMYWVPDYNNGQGAWASMDIVTAGQGEFSYCVMYEKGDTKQVVSKPGYEQPGMVAGDINGNGTLNVVDAQLTLDMANGVSFGVKRPDTIRWLMADVNADKHLDALDARAIQHAAVSGSWK
ncbi:MAG: S8 family serine peptidase [Coriobacteriia bacterium]|nr:S8 family serine peptidase [Coriobacteriia bacterium]